MILTAMGGAASFSALMADNDVCGTRGEVVAACGCSRETRVGLGGRGAREEDVRGEDTKEGEGEEEEERDEEEEEVG